jgi:hypothetical protein
VVNIVWKVKADLGLGKWSKVLPAVASRPREREKESVD